jgi:hypothetical protein
MFLLFLRNVVLQKLNTLLIIINLYLQDEGFARVQYIKYVQLIATMARIKGSMSSNTESLTHLIVKIFRPMGSIFNS